MASAIQYRKIIDDLFRRRTDWLLKHVLGKPSPGAPRKFSKREVDRAIGDLQEIASASLATKLAKTEFAKSVEKKKSWQVKGWGFEKKKQLFREWFEKHIPYDKCVYVFWKGKKCIYVGKSARGVHRPSSHFDKIHFEHISRIDVYAFRGKRPLPALECLAMHRFRPTKNKIKAQSGKWTKKCPLCMVHRNIDNEIRSIFGYAQGS